MLRMLLSSVMLLGISATGYAADAYVMNQNMFNPKPVYNWTGFFVGGVIGYGGGQFNNAIPTFAGPTGESGGLTAGAQVGYNRQLNRNWAIGLEADISTLDIEGSSVNGSFKEDWFATARVRGGYTFSRYFAYLTAGLAFTHKEAARAGFGSGDDIVTGFTGGVGLEGKINEKWSAKVEYLYVHVPDDGITTSGGVNVVGGSDNHIGRFGVNYHF